MKKKPKSEETTLQGLRRQRIEELKKRAETLSGGSFTHWQRGDLPPEVEEAFWEQVLAFEEAPVGTLADFLSKAGHELPPPDSLDDGELKERLWEIFEFLAQHRVFFECTDHLADRELYIELVEEILQEPYAVPGAMPGNLHIDLIGSGSDEHIELYLKHYADQESRERWQEEWPDHPIPEHVDPPFDRDRLLPKAEDIDRPPKIQ